MPKPLFNQPVSLSADGPIGVFDSGLGGLRVLDRLMHTLPEERFVYLGDTQHMPYGEKSAEQVVEYVAGCLHWLSQTHGVKMVVAACNTAASVASHLFTQYEGVPFVDPVTPICRWLKTDGRYQKVGVLATDATVASNRYPKLLQALQSPIVLHQIACGNLATLIEEGRGDSPACDAALRQYLQPLMEKQVEAIILGCTHYPYVMDQVAALAPACEILDPSVFMALETKALLAQHGLTATQQTGRTVAEVDYFVTAEPERFYETSLRMPFQALAMKQPTVISTAIPQSLRAR